MASVSDEEWEDRHDVRSEPWDSGAVTVVEGSGVLAVFDAGSAARAAGVVSDVEAGIADVAAEVPYEWDRRVVVYALSDPAYLTGLHGLPGDDPLALDAVTFPVLSRPGGEVAATRFLLNPRVLGQPGLSRGRLIRHELTHVALGERLEDVPTWFSEGLAEYVSVRPLAPEQRAVSRGALEAAEQGLDELPSDDGFHGPASETHYGIAWWACEYLAEAYDEPMLWVLLDSMAAPGDNDSVLPRVLQLDEEQLARRAGRLLLQTYRPQEREEPKEPQEPEETEEPEGSPSGSPTP